MPVAIFASSYGRIWEGLKGEQKISLPSLSLCQKLVTSDLQVLKKLINSLLFSNRKILVGSLAFDEKEVLVFPLSVSFANLKGNSLIWENENILVLAQSLDQLLLLGEVTKTKKLLNDVGIGGVLSFPNSAGLNGVVSFDNLILTDDTQNLPSSLMLIFDTFILNNLIENLNGFIKRFLSILTGGTMKLIPLFVWDNLQILKNNLPELLREVQQLVNQIKSSTIDPQTQLFLLSSINNRLQKLENEIREAQSSAQILYSGVDSYEGQVQEIISEITEFGETASQILINAIEKGIWTFEKEIKVYLDGKDETDRVIGLRIEFFSEDVFISNINLEIKGEPSGWSQIRVELDSFTWCFSVEEIDYDKSDNSVRLWGRSEVCKRFAEPWKPRQSYFFHDVSASSILNALLDSVPIEWNIDDWTVKELAIEEAFPFDVARDLLLDIGAIPRVFPDGKVYLLYPYFDDADEVVPELVIRMSSSQLVSRLDSVRVLLPGEEAFPFALECDETELPPGQWAQVRVYSLLPYDFYCNADHWFKAEEGKEEEVEESFVLEPGESFIFRKPVYQWIQKPSVVEASPFQICLPSNHNQCELVEIKYLTKYDLWKLTNYQESKALVCSAVTKRSFTLNLGGGDRVETVRMRYSDSLYLARRRAEYELYRNKGFPSKRIRVPYDPSYIRSQGFILRSPYANGVVTGLSLEVEKEPLRIYVEMEVLECLP